jgi:hypothetical protein
MFRRMGQWVVIKTHDQWYFGRPNATMVIVDPGQAPAEALKVALASQGVQRDELDFDSPEIRTEFETYFG